MRVVVVVVVVVAAVVIVGGGGRGPADADAIDADADGGDQKKIEKGRTLQTSFLRAPWSSHRPTSEIPCRDTVILFNYFRQVTIPSRQ